MYLLFNLFISGFLVISLSETLSCYADDNNLYNSGKNLDFAKSNVQTEFKLVKVCFCFIYLFIYLFIYFNNYMAFNA